MIDIAAVEQHLREHNPGAVILTGFDAAIVGVTRTQNGEVLVYDFDSMLAICRTRGMSEEEVQAFGEDVILSFDEGHGTPVIMRRLEATYD